MNKEEIEDIKDDLRTLHKILWNENREGTYAIQKILEYINCLEQKESILDKVTDKLKEKIEIVEMVIDLCNADGRIAKYKIEQQKEEKKDLQEILNIIEGEKK